MSDDPLSKGLDRAAGQAKGLKALRPGGTRKGKGETKVAAYRIGEELIARIDRVAEGQGVDSRKKGAFVALLLGYALDALERGELEIPKRERADL